MSGGVVFRTQDSVCFLPATIAMKVLPVPEVARVPGAPRDLVGIALVDGDMIPVIAIGDARSAMLVCAYHGERIGLVGMELLATGEGGDAKPFDVAAAIAKVREGRWVV